ncbi:acyl-CoA synthetase [Ornithinimicrobium cavernae]|uniref:acyl-CoA synthetase n=1 Tax=Ornithinimicrobium cavernae TaxID=2666047 RepID=UPI00192A3C89|nr:acyl-CoA synthetase [Ornithinimicrobium cavernae]
MSAPVQEVRASQPVPFAELAPAASSRPQVRAVSLAQALRHNARRFPDRDAVVHGETRISWAQLDRMVDDLGAELQAGGIGRGDVVLVHSPNHIELIQVMYATWRIGAVFAPTNFRLTAGEAAGLADLCRPKALICHVDYADHAAAVGAEVDLTAGTWWIGAGEGQERAIAGIPAGGEPTVPDLLPGDHAWYFFTSGTSGRPKAAVLTHDQMGFVLTNHLCDLMPGTTEEDAHLVVAPLSHGAGIHHAAQVARAAKTVLPTSSSMDTDELWSLVERERVTNMFTVPTILKTLAEAPEATRYDHSSLRYVIYAGAPMYTADRDHARAVLGEVLVQYYGLGEVTGNITVLPPHLHGRPSPEGVEFGTCGYPRTGMEISIRAEDGTEVATREQGEICVAGPAVFAGYLNNDTANAEAFRDGWFRTGDLGMLDEEGFLYVTGRASDMFISGGSNIYPREIEEKLLKHPAVGECAVLGLPDPKWGEVGVAVCVPKAGAQVDEAELRAFLEPLMARYKMPKTFVFWETMPKSGYGKIVKRTIRETLLGQDGAV